VIALEQAREHLETLGLVQAAAVLEARLEQAAKQDTTYAEFLADLLGVETAARRQRYLLTRTRLAHLPFRRTLADFDFSFQPWVDDRQVRELAPRPSGGAAAPAFRRRRAEKADPALATGAGRCTCHRRRGPFPLPRVRPGQRWAAAASSASRVAAGWGPTKVLSMRPEAPMTTRVG